jgi:hypothetical protein
MTGQRSADDATRERRLRAWLARETPEEVPASLSGTLARLRAGTEPVVGRVTGSPRGPLPGRRLLAGLAAAVVLALAAVGTGLLAMAMQRQPAASPVASSAATSSPPASPSAVTPAGVAIGAPVLVGEQTGIKAALADSASGPVVSVFRAQQPGPLASPWPAGSTCPPSPVGIVGASSVAWATSDQSILLLAGDATAVGPVGIGFSSDCSQTTVLAPASATSWTASRAPSILSAGTWFLGMKPGDPQTVVAWSLATGQLAQKGGFLSWTTDGGRTWTSGQTDPAIPAGWDWAGRLWHVFPGHIEWSLDPASGFQPPSSIPIDVTWDPTTGQVPPLMATGVFRDRVLLAPTDVRTGNVWDGPLESVATDGSGTTRVQIATWRISVGPRFVAVEGYDIATQAPTLAVSSDGVHFVTRALPDEFAQAPTDSVALLALDDRVLVTDWPQTSNPADQVIHAWSVPVTGAPPPPPLPSPAVAPTPTPAVPVFSPTALAFWDQQRGLVAGSFGVPGAEAQAGRILRTTDGGRTWRTVDSPAGAVSEVWVTGTSDAWATTGCASTASCWHLLRSTDGGTTWTSVTTTMGNVTFGDARDGWAVGPAPGTLATGLYRTTDGGTTWTSVPSPCQRSLAGPLRTVAFRSATSGLAVCATTLGAGGEFHSVLSTSNGGATWQVRASVAPAPSQQTGTVPSVGSLQYGGYIQGIELAPDGTAWMWGDRMDVLVSTDGGVTWRGLGLTSDGAGVGVGWPLDARHAFAIVGDPNRQATLFQVTADGGRTWQERTAWPYSAPVGTVQP